MGKVFNISLAIFAATGFVSFVLSLSFSKVSIFSDVYQLFLFGYDAGVMTDVIASNNFLAYFKTVPTSPIIGTINSTFNGGAVFGSLMGGLTMDRFGRKMTIQMGALICLDASFAGWAIGLLSMSVPVYQSECAHPDFRGLIVGMAQQMIGVGFIVSTWVGYGSHQAGDQTQFQWRFPLAFQAVPCLILAVGMIFFPESPRHLIAKDREDEAMKILRKLHFNGHNDAWIQEEFNEMRTTIAAEKAITVPGWRVMFTVPQWRTRLLHGTAVQVFTQMTGINVIGYYQVIMYEALGFTGGKAILVSGIYNCIGPIANFIFIVFILDRVGRRKPLIIGTIGITIALILEGIVNSQNPGGKRHGLSVAGVFFLFCVSIIFSCSFGPISWVYMSEIMPMQIRARGNAFATGIGNWLVATFWAQISPIALGDIGWKFYFLFVAFNICVTLPVVFFIFKETTKVSLENIDFLFDKGRALGTLPDDLQKGVELQPGERKEGEVTTAELETEASKGVHEQV